MSNTPQRVQLSSDFQELRSQLQTLIPILEKEADWYGSVYVERKRSRSASANLKQTDLSENAVAGAALRIYDGFTLHEQATDELNPAALKKAAETLAKRVSESASSREGLPRRPYKAPSWKERLQAELDPEITSQLPKELNPETPVHLGVRFKKNPTSDNPEQELKTLQGLLDRIKVLAPEEGVNPAEITFATVRKSFAVEESLFCDRETNLSQALHRIALTVIIMSGPERVVTRIGGLGGLEAIELPEDELRVLLRNLARLKRAERLKPGKYRMICGPVVSGVVAHEAFGHSQEGDTCARGRSKAWELFHSKEKVGNQHATIMNNPAVYDNAGGGYAAWGSYFFDEEGWLAKEQVLLQEGVLQSPMTNLTSALRLGVPRSANGKRESWAQGVYTRQTNTYFTPGDKTLDELLQILGDGYIGTEPAGGMEDPKGMGIQVGLQFVEEVKSGKLTGRLFKGPAGGDIQLTGYTPDVLNAILAKSKIECEVNTPDKAKHPFNDVGGCGKYHKEFVYAGCGGPYMLLESVQLG